MSNSVHSLQTLSTEVQTEQTVQPPPNQPITAASPIPQDTVTISDSAKQALANTANRAVGGPDRP